MVRVRTVAQLDADGAAEAAVHPLLETAGRLARLDTRVRFDTEAPAAGGWVSLADAATPENVRAHLDALGADRRGMRSVAAAQLVAGLACTVVRPLMAMLHVQRRVPALPPEYSYVRAPDGGRFEQLALLGQTLATLPDDPCRDHPAVRTVPGTDELLTEAATAIDAALTPVLRTIRVQGRYGLPQQWGAVFDMIGATSLLSARMAGLDQQRTWRHAQRLCALVRERVEASRACLPRPFPVAWSGGDALYTVKGTCCLRYREHGIRAGEPAPDDAGGTAYCKTCPFLCDETRRTECREQMERESTRPNPR